MIFTAVHTVPLTSMALHPKVAVPNTNTYRAHPRSDRQSPAHLIQQWHFTASNLVANLKYLTEGQTPLFSPSSQLCVPIWLLF